MRKNNVVFLILYNTLAKIIFTIIVVLDQHLCWDNHIDHLLRKFNSRFFLLRRAKKCLTISCRKLLYKTLVKPILEYCCIVWGNCSNEHLLRLVRFQKRRARLILNVEPRDSSVYPFSTLNWLPIDDTIFVKDKYKYRSRA